MLNDNDIWNWCDFYDINFIDDVTNIIILIPVETLNSGILLLSPPHNNPLMQQRDNMQVTQPCSVPSSPIASPGALSSTSFTIPAINGGLNIIDTTDPNWQATKPTVRERNAAMFNNELMADIKFVVGCDGELYKKNYQNNYVVSRHNF